VFNIKTQFIDLDMSKMSIWRNLFFAGLVGSAIAATPAQWRSQSIYFMLTDRFARTDGSTTATCNTGDRVCLIAMMPGEGNDVQLTISI
jgi:hypothetical protein